jgi:hypothetical protein
MLSSAFMPCMVLQPSPCWAIHDVDQVQMIHTGAAGAPAPGDERGCLRLVNSRGSSTNPGAAIAAAAPVNEQAAT